MKTVIVLIFEKDGTQILFIDESGSCAEAEKTARAELRGDGWSLVHNQEFHATEVRCT